MPHQCFNVATNSQNVRLELSFRLARTERIAWEKQDLKDGKESGETVEIKVKSMEANDVG